jgi:uncharacterized protein YdeI (YjbR/CyaY-like superfamily)
MKRARYPMPADVKTALSAGGVTADYHNRPAYQQNDYTGWITRAGSDETRLRRIAQMVAELKKGGVYMKMAHAPSRKTAK